MLSRILSLTSLLMTLCLASVANAFPRGCEVSGFGYDNSYLILNDTGEQMLFLIQNRSSQRIELERYETRDVFMSPKLEVKLEASNWAAFAADVSGINFKCLIREADNMSPVAVDCAEILDVCQYPRAKFALSNMGSYWISTNKPQSQVIQDTAAKGIYLKW